MPRYTGTPRQTSRQSSPDRLAGDELLGSFDVDRITPETLLFQAGYLTIKSFMQHGGFRRFELTYPNLEVRSSMTGAILGGLVESASEKARIRSRVFDALEVYLVGVEFDKADRNITGFGWERVDA